MKIYLLRVIKKSGTDITESMALYLKIYMYLSIISIIIDLNVYMNISSELIFIYYLIDLIRKLRKNKSNIAYGVANFIIVVFICAFVSVPEPYNLFIWFMLAMGESLVSSMKDKEENENINS